MNYLCITTLCVSCSKVSYFQVEVVLIKLSYHLYFSHVVARAVVEGPGQREFLVHKLSNCT